MLCSIDGWNVRLVASNFFNGSPGLNVWGVGCIRVFAAIVAVAIVLAIVRSTVVLVLIAVVVGTVVIIASPRRTLTFFVSPLGPTVRFVVPHFVAVVTFDIVLIVLLLHAGIESFVLTIFALFADAALVLIGDESDNSVRQY